jgi:type II secretory pathway pseudopilin PulG
VVAIIAILAAIAVPNFLEAQVRSKVSRVRSDHRSLATAIETYYVDNNEYPAMTKTTNQTADFSLFATPPAEIGRTFRVRNNTQLLTLTTPIAYVTTLFPDPFADTRGLGFRYFTDGRGWILGSYGPDVDQAVGGDLRWQEGTIAVEVNPTDPIETAYNSRISQPSLTLLTGRSAGGPAGVGSYTYDPTNGTVSDGDLWRVKQ